MPGMILEKLFLKDFRNFQSKLISLSPKVTAIVGPNASGKTNLLESLFLLSTGKSFRVRTEEEMINHQAVLARVKAKFESGTQEVVLTRGEGMPRKKLLVNGVGKRLVDYTGHFPVVFFGPWDLELISGSPSARRKFLDTHLAQIDREYRRALLSYEKGLRQRNKLLFQIREEGGVRTSLLFWDKLLIKNGDYLSSKREEFINFANGMPTINKEKFVLEYDKSAISEARLKEYENEEIAAATTLVGPHRDDLVFKFKAQDLAKFGSRGEQRMAILWLKLRELDFVQETIGEKPTLLLDDIFSELDKKHRKLVAKLADNQQTIITTTEEEFLVDYRDLRIIKLGPSGDKKRGRT